MFRPSSHFTIGNRSTCRFASGHNLSYNHECESVTVKTKELQVMERWMNDRVIVEALQRVLDIN